jgi:sodium-dependent dicarboxylate transporter 2/3/5
MNFRKGRASIERKNVGIINWVCCPVPEKLHNFLYSKKNFFIAFFIAISSLYFTSSQPVIIRKTVFTFVFSAGCWVLEVFPLPITGLMIPLLLTLLGVFPPETSFAPFSHPVVFLMIGGLVLGQSITKHSLDKWIAYKLLEYSRGSIDRLVFLLMAASAFLSMWMSNTVGMAILLPIAVSMLSSMPKELINLRMKVLIGLSISTSIGGMATLTGSTPAMIGSAILEKTRPFGFLQWAYYGLPISIIALLITFLVLKKIFPSPEVLLQLDNVLEQKKGIGPLTLNQKLVILVFTGTIFLWFFGSQLEIFLGLPPSISSAAIVSILSVLVMFGINLLDMRDLTSIQWEIVFIVGGGILLGNAISVSGTASKIGASFASLEGIIPIYMILFLFIIVSMAVTNFISNSATAAMLIPIAIEIADMTDINPVIFVMGTALASTIAFITPVGAPSTAMVYATGQVPKERLVKTGIIIGILVSFVVFLVISILPAI